MNRDLLVLSKQSHLSQDEINRQTELLNHLLYPLENWSNYCMANEIIDINRRKIISKAHLMKSMLQDYPNKPFVFICNKN